jgi:RHS repeat-associated protein
VSDTLDLTTFVGKSTYDFGRKKSDAGISAIAYNVQGDRDYLKPYQQLAAMGPLQNAPDLNEMMSGGNMPLQRTTGASHTNASGGDIFSSTYGYNTGGELTSSVTGTTNLSYGYDGIGQLTSANKSAPSASSAESFAFDAAGNRTSDSARTYTVGTNNRILSDNFFTYTYDNEGNRTRMRETSSGKETLYRYDYRNRLTRVEQIGVRTTEFTYDLFDRRIAKVVKANPNAVPSATTRYFYNGEMIWSQSLQSTNLQPTVTRFLTGDHIDQWLARSVQQPNSPSAGNTQWFLTDRMGTPQALVDNAGTVQERYEFDAFGTPRVGVGLSLPQIGFTGREFDGETGLMYYRARYLDPAVGQFLSEDPIGFEAGDSNLRRYVENSSFNMRDSDG